MLQILIPNCSPVPPLLIYTAWLLGSTIVLCWVHVHWEGMIVYRWEVVKHVRIWGPLRFWSWNAQASIMWPNSFVVYFNGLCGFKRTMFCKHPSIQDHMRGVAVCLSVTSDIFSCSCLYGLKLFVILLCVVSTTEIYIQAIGENCFVKLYFHVVCFAPRSFDSSFLVSSPHISRIWKTLFSPFPAVLVSVDPFVKYQRRWLVLCIDIQRYRLIIHHLDRWYI